MLEIGVALVFVMLIGALFFGCYLDGRNAATDPIVDPGPLALLLGLLSVVVGVLIGQGWALMLPLVVAPFAVATAAIAAVDERYTAGARDRGGASGDDWLGVAAVVCSYTIPGVAVGIGLAALGGRLEV